MFGGLVLFVFVVFGVVYVYLSYVVIVDVIDFYLFWDEAGRPSPF